ncbi:histidine kinase dimerization/phospho-acceptor domain-containing protein, partial [Corynebacterium sp. UMB6689]|nr:histidine kinase dimerization/phospho-acceptor domain-containing protein [Corynebacterium sp. UMB6689]
VRLPQDYDDEIGDLSRDFNRMAASLEGSIEEINRQENIRRQFMLDVAHEMRTPLTTMNGLLEGLRYGLIPEKHFDR